MFVKRGILGGWASVCKQGDVGGVFLVAEGFCLCYCDMYGKGQVWGRESADKAARS
jgi:hypothetical protein